MIDLFNFHGLSRGEFMKPIILPVTLTLILASGFASSAPTDEKPGMPTAAPSPTAHTLHWQGVHTMTGTVSHLDKSKGTLTLDSDVGPLNLHFPPAALKTVQDGERITVQLGFTPAPEKHSTPETHPIPPAPKPSSSLESPTPPAAKHTSPVESTTTPPAPKHSATP
jgi:hypothetical protein